jgi:hypothetical protein
MLEINLKRLEENQKLREAILSDMTKEGIPSKAREKEIMLRTMADMDLSIHNTEKINIVAEQNQAQAEMAKTIGQMLMNFTTKTPLINSADKELSIQHQQIELVPGELDQGTSRYRFDDIERLTNL